MSEKKYTSESPEVVAYLGAFGDVSIDAAIGAVQNMRETILAGNEVAIPTGKEAEVMTIIEMIKADIASEAKNEPVEGDATVDEESAGSVENSSEEAKFDESEGVEESTEITNEATAEESEVTESEAIV